MYLNGEGITSRGPRGERIRDDSFYIIFNAHHEDLDFVLPDALGETHFHKVFGTQQGFTDEETIVATGTTIPVVARSMIVLIRLDCPVPL